MELLMLRRRGQQGFTLIEILVSLIILAVGFLGLAALQSSSLQGTQNTYFRTQADLLANDMAERMRANRAAVQDGEYEFDGGAAPADPGCGGAGADCDSAEIAAADLNEWLNWVQNALPAGDAIISQPLAGLWTIQMMWDERRNGAAGQDCDPNDENDLACLIINVQIRNPNP